MFSVLVFVVVSSGCGASQRPVLYPNAHLKSVGDAVAQQDIDECMAMASNAGVSPTSGPSNVAGSTTKTAAVGAAAGAAGGAVRGHAGRGAATGAAAGGAAGFMRALFKGNELDPTYKNFVARCLHERGYETIGWK